MILQIFHKDILALCADDYTGLWLVVSTIAGDAYSFDGVPEWVRQKTIEVVRDLLQSNLIEAGYIDLSDHKFQSFDLSLDETINYIEREWDKLGRTPNIGDICEFSITPAGGQLIQELKPT